MDFGLLTAEPLVCMCTYVMRVCVYESSYERKGWTWWIQADVMARSIATHRQPLCFTSVRAPAIHWGLSNGCSQGKGRELHLARGTVIGKDTVMDRNWEEADIESYAGRKTRKCLQWNKLRACKKGKERDIEETESTCVTREKHKQLMFFLYMNIMFNIVHR